MSGRFLGNSNGGKSDPDRSGPNRSVENYLKTVMKLSDSLYYSIIKNTKTCQIRPSVNGLTCFVKIIWIRQIVSLFSADGELLESVPALRVRNNLDVTKGRHGFPIRWIGRRISIFSSAGSADFESSSDQYRWVIPLTRVVEITKGTDTVQGIFADPSEIIQDLSCFWTALLWEMKGIFIS